MARPYRGAHTAPPAVRRPAVQAAQPAAGARTKPAEAAPITRWTALMWGTLLLLPLIAVVVKELLGVYNRAQLPNAEDLDILQTMEALEGVGAESSDLPVGA